MFPSKLFPKLRSWPTRWPRPMPFIGPKPFLLIPFSSFFLALPVPFSFLLDLISSSKLHPSPPSTFSPLELLFRAHNGSLYLLVFVASLPN